MTLIQDLEWRHACKRMTGAKVAQEKIDRILEAIRLAPTSIGLQGFKIIVIENEELKNEIFEKACQQLPVKGCSHLLIFAHNKTVTAQMLDEHFDRIEKTHNQPKEFIANYRGFVEKFLDRDPRDTEDWLKSQAYIALGIACAAAANERIESVPMEAFNKEELYKILKLEEKNLAASVILPLGIQDIENDWMANKPKMRKKINELVEVIK